MTREFWIRVGDVGDEIAETDRAILLPLHDGRDLWWPKSQLEQRAMPEPFGPSYFAPRWLAAKQRALY